MGTRRGQADQAPVRDTPHEGFPLLVVSEGIEHTEDGRLLADGTELAPGRYRVRLTEDVDDPETVLTVPDPGTDDVLFGMLDDFR